MNTIRNKSFDLIKIIKLDFREKIILLKFNSKNFLNFFSYFISNQKDYNFFNIYYFELYDILF
jgi:hypothetical protein